MHQCIYRKKERKRREEEENQTMTRVQAGTKHKYQKKKKENIGLFFSIQIKQQFVDEFNHEAFFSHTEIVHPPDEK